LIIIAAKGDFHLRPENEFSRLWKEKIKEKVFILQKKGTDKKNRKRRAQIDEMKKFRSRKNPGAKRNERNPQFTS
jgi:hypothetical protein